MFIFYVDESGSPESHSEPLLNGQTPLFVLASLAFVGYQIRQTSRAINATTSREATKALRNGRAAQQMERT